jgi:hypothetical protein
VKRFGYRLAACLLLAAAPGAASAQNAETYKESAAEREACTSDVWRLCKRFIPSRTAIASCLERSSDLSPACAAVMRGPSAEAGPARPRDPRQ